MASSLADKVADTGDIPAVPASMLSAPEDAYIPVSSQGMSSDLDNLTSSVKSNVEKLFPQIEKAESDKAAAAKTQALGEAQQIGKYRDQLAETLKEHPITSPDTGKQPDLPPNEPMQRFGSLASMLGIFASAFTKKPMVNALNASAAAMNAQRAGDVDAYKEAYQQWKDNTELALKKHNIEMENLHEILDMSKEDNASALAQLKAYGVAQSSDAASVLSQLGDWSEIGKWVKSMQKAGTGLASLSGQLFNEQVGEFVKTHGRLPTTEEQIDMKRKAEGKGERPLTGNQKEQKVQTVREIQDIQGELDKLLDVVTKNKDSVLPVTGWMGKGTEALEYGKKLPGVSSAIDALGISTKDDNPAQEVGHLSTIISDRLPAVMVKMGYGPGAIKEMQNLLGTRSMFTDNEQAQRNIREVKEMLQTKADEIKDATEASGFNIDEALGKNKPASTPADTDGWSIKPVE